MHDRISTAAVALALACTFLAAPVAWPGESAHQFSPTLYWFCQSSTVPPAYTSTVVVTVASGSTNETILPELAATKRDIEKSFADFLAKKHGYTGLSSCNSSESKDWMESFRNERLETLRTHKLQIVETGWVYEATASTPTATAPVPSTPGLAHNAATGAGAAPMQSWTVCYVLGAPFEPAVRTDRGSHVPIYVSGAVPTAPPQDSRDVAQAFAQFIAKTKPYPAGMTPAARGCWTERSPVAALKLIKQADSIVVPGEAFGLDCTPGECVMTDWTSMPASHTADTTPQPPVVPPTQRPAPVAAAPVPVKPTAPSTAVRPATVAIVPAAQTPYAFCFGEVTGLHQTVYFGVPFKAPEKDAPAWSAAYKEFLRNKYQFSGPIHCPTQKSLAEARQQAQKVEERYLAHWKIIETGWKYQ